MTWILLLQIGIQNPLKFSERLVNCFILEGYNLCGKNGSNSRLWIDVSESSSPTGPYINTLECAKQRKYWAYNKQTLSYVFRANLRYAHIVQYSIGCPQAHHD